jgi:hypothetical protein
MKLSRITFQVFAIGMLLHSVPAMAQDADKQKLMEIEKAFAAQSTPNPQAAMVMKKYLFDGPGVQVTGMGRIGTLPKARIVELYAKPDSADPNVKSATSISDVRVELYGDTALASYKMTNTDTGHKDPALNVTDHFGCLDTFVKRKGEWYAIGDACSPAAPLAQTEWDAAKKARAQEPKDVQAAYH